MSLRSIIFRKLNSDKYSEISIKLKIKKVFPQRLTWQETCPVFLQKLWTEYRFKTISNDNWFYWRANIVIFQNPVHTCKQPLWFRNLFTVLLLCEKNTSFVFLDKSEYCITASSRKLCCDLAMVAFICFMHFSSDWKVAQGKFFFEYLKKRNHPDTLYESSFRSLSGHCYFSPHM